MDELNSRMSMTKGTPAGPRAVEIVLEEDLERLESLTTGTDMLDVTVANLDNGVSVDMCVASTTLVKVGLQRHGVVAREVFLGDTQIALAESFEANGIQDGAQLNAHVVDLSQWCGLYVQDAPQQTQLLLAEDGRFFSRGPTPFGAPGPIPQGTWELEQSSYGTRAFLTADASDGGLGVEPWPVHLSKQRGYGGSGFGQFVKES